MNTAFLSLDRFADFAFVAPRAVMTTPRRSDACLFGQLAGFCTRVLLVGGRSPLDEPMLSRDLLSVYSYGAVEALADDAGLDAEDRTGLVTRLFREVLQLSEEDAANRAMALGDTAEWATPALQDMIRRGASAFAEWLDDPTDFVPADFRQLMAVSTATAPLR